jgi:hypothetical protein
LVLEKIGFSSIMNHAEVGFDQLKCDITLLPNSQDGTRSILLLNFNLPKVVVEDRQVELPQRLGQIVNFLRDNFASETIYYQLSSSYWIQKRNTEDIRRWVGSFFAKNTAAASISGATFIEFDPRTFVREGLDNLRGEHIRSVLTINFLDSAWHFVDLISVVVNCQLVVPVNHPFITRHELGSVRRHQRRVRRHIVLFPFGPDALGEIAPLP